MLAILHGSAVHEDEACFTHYSRKCPSALLQRGYLKVRFFLCYALGIRGMNTAQHARRTHVKARCNETIQVT
jgi:hypothetical protein